MAPSLSQRSWILPWLLFILFPTSSLAHAAPIEFEEYRSRIRESIALVQGAESGITAVEAAILRERFPTALQVNKEGKTAKVDALLLGRWIDEAERSPAGKANLLNHLNGLFEQISTAGTSLDREKGSVALNAVLDSREFRHLKETQKPPWKAWIQNRLRKIMKWLSQRFGKVEGKTLAWGSIAILGAIAIAGVILFVWAIRSIRIIGWRWRKPRTDVARVFREEPLPDWKRLRSEAEKKAAQGALRDAVRLLFLSVLLEGHAKGWWSYRPESTNTEHLLQISAQSKRKDAFINLARIYEDAWYGLKSPGPEDFANCRSWAAQLESV